MTHKHDIARSFFAFMLLLFSLASSAQTEAEIKADGSKYYWAEGTGPNLKEAKDMALHDLVAAISTNVASSATAEDIETNKNGVIESMSSFESRTATYTSVRLNNSHIKQLTPKAPYRVLRYIEKTEVENMFREREERVKEYANIANNALLDKKLDDALRYYYSAYLLTQSLCYSGRARVTDENGDEQRALTWLRHRIEDILSNVRVSLVGNNNDETNTYILGFFYKDSPVASIGYTYYYGSDWTENPEIARDGRGLAILKPGFSPSDVKVRIEYKFANQIHNDPELQSVYESMADFIDFGTYGSSRVHQNMSSELGADGGLALASATKKDNKSMASALRSRLPEKNLSAQEAAPYIKSVESVIKAIKSKSYASVESLFTSEGYKCFDQLIRYGEARIIGTPDLTFAEYGKWIFARSIPMQFSFRANHRFTENVVLTFTKEGKIDNVTFGLGNQASAGLFATIPDEKQAAVRSALSNFLENYKTAYALGRMDYLESVFSDDALIITGRVVERLVRDSGDSEKYHTGRVVTTTRQTKQQYLANLKRAFNAKEYVNIKFANSEVRPSTKAIKAGRDVYGIQLRQDYYSNNYSDQGYLFLLVDVSNPDEPIIHVRVWQEKPDEYGRIADITDF